MSFDKRLTPARPDLAAAHLKGKVKAARFAKGKVFSVTRGHVPLRAKPSDKAAQETELLFGENFIVYEKKKGWAWGQLMPDDYVGYVRADALGKGFEINARVGALMTPLLSAPDVKSPARDMLPLNARLTVLGGTGSFAEIAGGGFIAEPHLARPYGGWNGAPPASDWVAIAEKFVGVPYLWGGKTQAGLDCSGLIQTARHAAGLSCPRDTDMQMAALGESISGNVRRGDLVFWKGHVGVMLDAARLVHANAFHNEVAIEPLDEAKARIAQSGLDIVAVKRP